MTKEQRAAIKEQERLQREVRRADYRLHNAEMQYKRTLNEYIEACNEVARIGAWPFTEPPSEIKFVEGV